MSLPSYKLNNSYTVYVNYYYLNDCIQAGKKYAQKKKKDEAVAKRVQKTWQSQKASPINKNSPADTQATKPVNQLAIKKAISIGCTVYLLNLDTQQKCCFVLTNPKNIAIGTNKISSASPVGQSLLNRKVGDSISVEIPLGTVRYKVLSFEC